MIPKPAARNQAKLRRMGGVYPFRRGEVTERTENALHTEARRPRRNTFRRSSTSSTQKIIPPLSQCLRVKCLLRLLRPSYSASAFGSTNVRERTVQLTVLVQLRKIWKWASTPRKAT